MAKTLRENLGEFGAVRGPERASVVICAALAICAGVAASCDDTMLDDLGGPPAADFGFDIPDGYAELQLPNSGNYRHGDEKVHFPIQVLLERQDLEAYLEDAVIEAVEFRDLLFERDEAENPYIDQIARMTREFTRDPSTDAYLTEGLPSLDFTDGEFQHFLSADLPRETVRRFDEFKGSWIGRWDGMDVHHFWSEVIVPSVPTEIEMENGRLVRITAYQYCWIGDGYALNMLVDDFNGDAKTSWILGHVVHLRDIPVDYLDRQSLDLDNIAYSVPHVAMLTGNGFIWITPSAVFVESTNSEVYHITGFNYDENYVRGVSFHAEYQKTRDDMTQDPVDYRLTDSATSPEYEMPNPRDLCRLVSYGVGCNVVQSLDPSESSGLFYPPVDINQWRPGVGGFIFGDNGENFISTCFATPELRAEYVDMINDDPEHCGHLMRFRLLSHLVDEDSECYLAEQDVDMGSVGSVHCVTEGITK